MSSVTRKSGWLDCFYKNYASTKELILKDLKASDAGKALCDTTAGSHMKKHLCVSDTVSDQMFC